MSAAMYRTALRQERVVFVSPRFNELFRGKHACDARGE